MVFYLGTHEPAWLRRTSVPLFLSRRRLARLKGVLPRALGPWALDSGGFSELALHGAWETSPRDYAAQARRYAQEVGNMAFAAIQDWMCEPFMLAKTGKTVRDHQQLSVRSFLDLMDLAPEVPWCPVLQGWAAADYVEHAALYEAAGVDLGARPRVGVGSVCRRQATAEAVAIFEDLRTLKLKLHGFGLKKGFLKLAFRAGLESFDSMAWSYRARRHGTALEGCQHKSCANCMKFALLWREQVISIGRRQGEAVVYP